MSKYVCPNGHENEHAIVCGGDGPHHRHWTGPEPIEEATAPNVYFLMEIPSGELTREVWSDLPFTLTDEDWEEMHDHCAGGCCSEPQCTTCYEYLNMG